MVCRALYAIHKSTYVYVYTHVHLYRPVCPIVRVFLSRACAGVFFLSRPDLPACVSCPPPPPPLRLSFTASPACFSKWIVRRGRTSVTDKGGRVPACVRRIASKVSSSCCPAAGEVWRLTVTRSERALSFSPLPPFRSTHLLTDRKRRLNPLTIHILRKKKKKTVTDHRQKLVEF